MTESICFVKYGREPGKVHKGYIEKCFLSTDTYAAFYAIAYAAPPDGTKLFQAPEPLTTTEPNKEDENDSIPQTTSAAPGPSTSSFTAPDPFMSSDQAKILVKEKICVQAPGFNKGSSDCLYLNVFCPRDPKLTKELLPVLVFIHGGGFDRGSNDPDNYSPEKIVQFDVVFVSINYRLGAYGFLNLHTKEVPGNAGLKDQVEALRWIRDNIAYFKGDPENVTLSGWNAGATCVNCHLISPMSKGLFHKAIVQSGGIYWPWGYRDHGFEQIKTILGNKKCKSSLHDKEKSKEVLKLAHKLLGAKHNIQHPYSSSPLYGPTSEKYEEGAFLTGKIETLIEQVQPASMPVMAGIVTNEDLDMSEKPQKDWRQYSIQNNKVFRQFLMDNFHWSRETAKKNAKMIRDKYFPPESLSSGKIAYPYMKDFFHDLSVHQFYDCFKFGPEKKVHQKLYVYHFEHFSEISVRDYDYNNTHYAPNDVRYLYTPTQVKLKYQKSIYEGSSQNKDILKVMDHMCSLWANFCKNGTPKSEFDSNVEWKPYTEEEPYYLSIDNNLVLKEGSVLSNRCIWLHELIIPPIPTIPSQKNTPEHE